jgi:hypothetical protein
MSELREEITWPIVWYAALHLRKLNPEDEAAEELLAYAMVPVIEVRPVAWELVRHMWPEATQARRVIGSNSLADIAEAIAGIGLRKRGPKKQERLAA